LEEYQQFNETKQKIALTISSLAEEDMEALGRSCSELVLRFAFLLYQMDS
jgi:hypothetical protein